MKPKERDRERVHTGEKRERGMVEEEGVGEVKRC
jgi:hypothetical protein